MCSSPLIPQPSQESHKAQLLCFQGGFLFFKMYLSVPLITMYLIFIGHLFTLLCGFSGPFISPLIGSRQGSRARASDEICVCVVFNF